jgi:NADH-quinone oxidoreductase subunit J
VTVEAILFYVFGSLAVVSALGMVLNTRNTVASVMSLVVTMVSLGAVYLLLEAYLIAAIQIMVYGGAIVVLFLFVVMLLNLSTDEFPAGKQREAARRQVRCRGRWGGNPRPGADRAGS